MPSLESYLSRQDQLLFLRKVDPNLILTVPPRLEYGDLRVILGAISTTINFSIEFGWSQAIRIATLPPRLCPQIINLDIPFLPFSTRQHLPFLELMCFADEDFRGWEGRSRGMVLL